MKRTLILLITTSFLLGFASCEDVIDVDLPSEDPRLIIDALIRVDSTQPSTLVTVKVSETNSFFETVPPANLQQVTMSNLDNPGGKGQVLLEEEPGSGIYSRLFPTNQLLADRWFLQVDFEDTFYVANAKLIPAVPLDSVEQGDGILFDENDTEVIITFTDSDERDDFYLFDFDFANFLVTEDEFYQGQQFSFSYFYDDQIEPGDQAEISIMGVDESFYNYMNKLIEQSEGPFGPFETPAITVRGNIINASEIDNNNNFNNTDNPDTFALGYFAIVHEFKEVIVFE